MTGIIIAGIALYIVVLVGLIIPNIGRRTVQEIADKCKDRA